MVSMPLHVDSKSLAEQELFVLPYYGHGWHRRDADASLTPTFSKIGPEPFKLRVTGWILHRDELVGIEGQVVTKAHHFFGYWCVACLRTSGLCNFRDQPGHYMLWLAQLKPTVLPSDEKALYEWVTIDTKAPVFDGYGTIAESADYLHDIIRRTEATRNSLTQHDAGSDQ